MNARLLTRIFGTAAFTLGCLQAASAAGFSVTSPVFTDGSAVPATGAQPNCGGGIQQTPPLAFANVPDKTKSFAILTYDPDTAGPGTAHWVAYGIPASMRAIPAGFGSKLDGYVSGLNVTGMPGFRGYCPPAGDQPHHYSFTVYATDLAPDALQPGLTRDQLLAALKGHVAGAQTIVGKYAQP